MRCIGLALLFVLLALALPGISAPPGKAQPSAQELTRLVNQLREKDAALRRQAVQRLMQLRDPRAVPLLEPLCKVPQISESACAILAHTGKEGVTALLKLAGAAKDRWLRLNIAKALSASNDPRAVKAMRNTLRDADAEFRALAVNALAPRLRDPAVREDLFARLKDTAPRVRDAALNALQDQVDPRLVEPLAGWLQAADPQKIGGAAARLQAIGDARARQPLQAALTRCLERLPAGTEFAHAADKPWATTALASVLRALTHLRDVDTAMALTKDRRPWARAAAVDAISRLADPRAAEVCLAALRDPNPVVYAAAVSAAYYQYEDPRLQEALLAACRDRSAGIRAMALERLPDLAPDRLLPVLADAVRDENEYIRSVAATRLGTVNDPRAVKLLLALLDEADRNSRRAAITALGRTNDPQAVEALLARLRPEDADAPDIAAALSACTDPRLGQAFLALLPKANDERLRAALYAGLGSVGEPRALDMLLKALKTEKGKHANQSVLAALGVLGDARAADPVFAFYQQAKDNDLRGRALQTLGILKDPRVLPLLLAALDQVQLRRYAIAGLAAYGGPQAFDALAPLLNERDRLVQRQVVEAMGELDDPRAVPLLIAALGQPNPWVRLAVAEGLKQCGPRAQLAVGPLITVMEKDPEVASRRLIADALFAITGQALGIDPAKWRAWQQAN